MNDRVEGPSSQRLTGLRRSLNCPILIANDQDYDQARRVWNGMIDRKPAAIVPPTSIADVMQVVRFAPKDQVAVCVRGGGHSVAGKSVADDAMMIDLSLMNGIQVNPSAHTAAAQGGAKWGDFDRECEHLSARDNRRRHLLNGSLRVDPRRRYWLGDGQAWSKLRQHGLRRSGRRRRLARLYECFAE
jgi:hypothetical protein